MTLALPPYDPNDPGSLQFILDRIAASGIDTGGRSLKLRYGSSSVTFTASATSAEVTIPHGLGSVPGGLYFGGKTPVNAKVSIQESAAADATNFKVKGYETAGGAVTLSQNFYWLALG